MEYMVVPYFLCMMDVDYLIAGGGLCGALLGRYLLLEGCSVLVIDDRNAAAAGRVAGGIVNPVTGKRLVRSWMTEVLLPFALQAYRELEEELHVALVQPCSLFDFFANREEQRIFEEKATGEKEYLTVAADGGWGDYFRFNYGVGVIAPCLLVDLNGLLGALGLWLHDSGCLLAERFDWKDCMVGDDGVVYRDIRAKKVICCEGADGDENPYFKMLPWSKDKGEAMIAAIAGLPRGAVYKQGISIAPWRDGLWWIGATHDWKYTDLLPTAAFRKRVEEQLDYWLKMPYTIVDHLVARRPANLERRPFAGLHPRYPSIGILNGMGGKGASMAPYFAHQLAQHLVHEAAIMPEVDVLRFGRVLSR